MAAQNSIPLQVGLRMDRSGLKELRATVGRGLRSFEDPKFSKKAVAAIRNSAEREFRGHYWAMPQGGHRAWEKNVLPFGNKPFHAPMVDSGAYHNALMGRGFGSIERVSGRRIEVGVDASHFKYAKMIRGGAGANISLAPTFVRPKKKARGKSRTGAKQYAMFWLLGLKFGVWMTLEKLMKGIRVPPRPHLTSNPELRRDLVRIAEDHVFKKVA